MEDEVLVRAALDEAYAAFSDVPRPRELQACPHCRDGKAILAAITSVPLRDVDAKDIGPYCGWAMTTVGTSEDYRHFVPRILELAVMEDSWVGTSPYVIASKLTVARWEMWPDTQKHAVIHLFEAAFEYALGSGLDVVAPNWLFGLAGLGVSLKPHLETWRERRDVPAGCQLAWFVITDAKDVASDGTLSDAAWEEAVPASTRKLVGSWLKSEATRSQIASFVGKFSTDDAWMIDAALALLP